MGFLDDPRAREASRLAFLADQLLARDVPDARRHYARAAALEAELLAALPPEAQALYSTLAVSAVALWFKAKHARSLDELATRLLAGDGLTPEARAEIAEMRVETLQEEQEMTRRQIVLTTFDLEDNFRLLIEAALNEAGTIIKAAEYLGINRHALRRKIDKYGIEWPPGEKTPPSEPSGRRPGV